MIANSAFLGSIATVMTQWSQLEIVIRVSTAKAELSKATQGLKTLARTSVHAPRVLIVLQQRGCLCLAWLEHTQIKRS